MHTLKPYRIIPRLIEQSTWGGDYILRHKGYFPRGLNGRKIGQSYELFQGSLLQPLSCDATTAALGDATSEQVELIGTEQFREQIFPLSELIAQDPGAVLGENVTERYGEFMPLLLKMNQALGNSYQLHIPYAEESPAVRQKVRENPWMSPEEAGGYLAKPESWYYLQTGRATLGLNPDTAVEDYQASCQRIDQKLQLLSRAVQAGEQSLEAARSEAQVMIQAEAPWQYVNTLEISAGSVVELSAGGTHHSWEADLEKLPEGNIVYEIQLDRMDTISTLRSFDQGKIKDDGSIRPLNIEAYFEHLATDAAHNDSTRLIQAPTPVEAESDRAREILVQNDFYTLEKYRVHALHSLARVEAPGSFQHWFVQSGNVRCTAGEQDVVLHQGESCFVPAALGPQMMGSFHGQEAEVLVAYVPAQ